MATRRNRSRIQVAIGMPLDSAASRKACFSAVVTRSSMYSSSGVSFFGRPRFGMELLYQQKTVESQDISVIAFAYVPANHKTIKVVESYQRSLCSKMADWDRNRTNRVGKLFHA
jgi:hypothetical protein